MALKIYHDEDADETLLKGKTVAVIGYGIQGRAQALCLKDSGVKVVAGISKEYAFRKGPENTWTQAEKDGVQPMEIADAAKAADIIMMLLPDMVQKKVYEDFIKPNLTSGKTLYFSHGFNITFKRIKPPKNIDVIMLAPKGPGAKVRETYLAGFGVPALLAIHQNATGKAKETALALAKAMHFTRAGVFECTFDQETISDLFGEQTVLCGGCVELIKAGFDTLVEDGFPPEVAYFECLHELKLITDLIQQGGLEYMWERVSETARYGGRTRGKRVIDARVRKTMKKILKEIKSGKFAKEWIAEYEAGMPKFKQMKEEESKLLIEQVGAEIRKMFRIGEQK
ncbi:MAG: ketol-acid reductoisomerase [Candidatus Micrarchaeia archaeon]